MPDTIRIGSVCTGYGGLDEAVRQVFGGQLAWVSDIDPGACQIIAHRMPGVPNLGDLTTTQWDDVEPVDVLVGGYPCQPFSFAGRRKGTSDERHIWPYIADALRVLRPRYAVFENVAGHLRLGFDTVLADLAGLGFDAQWCLVRASEVGAPHRRERLFLLATATDAPDLGHERGGDTRGRRPGPEDDRVPAAYAEGLGRGEGRTEPARQQGRSGVAVGGGPTTADTDGGRLARDPECDLRADEPRQQTPRRDHAERPGVRRIAPADATRLGHGHPGPQGERGVAATAVASRPAAHSDAHSGGQRTNQHDLLPGQPDAAWGRFHPAIQRWEAATGRRAPRATDDRHRLSPAFVEWMMGLPVGHVTDVPGLTRTQQLKALGNGVVPQQAASAIRLLADRAEVAA